MGWNQKLRRLLGIRRLTLTGSGSRYLLRSLYHRDISVSDVWEKDGALTLCARLRVEWDRPWEKNSFAMYHFQAEDSAGNRYGYELEIVDRGARLSGLRLWGQESHWNGWTWHVRLDDIPAEAEWVRFTYALRPDGPFELVLKLNREVGK